MADDDDVLPSWNKVYYYHYHIAGYLEQTNLVTSHVTSQITSTVIKAPARAENSEQNFFLLV